MVHPELTGSCRALMLAGELHQLEQASKCGHRVASGMRYWLWTHWPGWRSIRAVRPSEKLAENVRRQRMSLGLSQEQVAKRAEVHPSEVSRIERGVREPRLDTIVRLARALDVEPARLLDGIR